MMEVISTTLVVYGICYAMCLNTAHRDAIDALGMPMLPTFLIMLGLSLGAG